MTNRAYYAIARNVTALAYVSLLSIIFIDIWHTSIDGIAAKIVLWLLATAGLWLVFPGLLRQHRRSYQWLCFILLMYFIWYVQAWFVASASAKAGGHALAATHEVLALMAIVSGFCAAMFAARGRI